MFVGAGLERNSSSRLEEDLETSLEGNPSSRLERNPSTSLAEVLRSNMGKRRHPRRPLPWKGPPRQRVHRPRHLEEEADLETHLEEVLEIGQEANLGFR